MSAAPPIPMMFDGETFRPLPNFLRVARQHYGAGEVVPMAPHEERSMASHGHYFAMINEAWASLPEGAADRWATSEHLRKWALIRAGHRDERSIVCASKAEAKRVKAFIRPIDDYAVVVASEAVVTVYTAKSQSVKAMGKAAFQKSKDDVLNVLAELIGVRPADLANARAA